ADVRYNCSIFYIRRNLCHDLVSLTNRHGKQDKISAFKRRRWIIRYLIDNAKLQRALHILPAPPNANTMFDHASMTQRQSKGAPDQTDTNNDKFLKRGRSHDYE